MTIRRVVLQIALLSIVLFAAALTGCGARAGSTVVHGTGQYANAPAGRLFYEAEGQGEPVVIVPGGPGNSHRRYHPWFSRLSREGYRVVYFDHAGTGRSDQRTDGLPTVAGYAGDIEALRRTLAVERVNLVAMSFGSYAAVEYALRYPDRVRRMVLVNGQISAAGWQANNIDRMNRALQDHYPERWEKLLFLRAQGVKSSAAEIQHLYEDVVENAHWADAHHPEIDAVGDPRDRNRTDVYTSFIGDDPEWTVTGTLSGYDAGPRLAGWSVPTLIVSGRWDRMISPAASASVARTIPGATLRVFEKSAHRPWCEEPEAFFRTVGAYLR